MNTDDQLRATHLILGYKPISSSFQVPKCVIKAKDPRLHRISVVVPSFLLSKGVPIPRGTLTIESIFEGIPKVALPLQLTTEVTTSSRPTNTEEEEVVEVPNSKDKFEVFNQALSPKISIPNLGPPPSPILDKMGI